MKSYLLAFLLALAPGALLHASDLADAPLEPETTEIASNVYLPGALLEFWFLDQYVDFMNPKTGIPNKRWLDDPSVSAMLDTTDQLFSGNVIEKDPNLKEFLHRTGALRWTFYYYAKKPGKHVFTMEQKTNTGNCGLTERGSCLLVNNEGKIWCFPGEVKSATLDFATPGLYKMQLLNWWTRCDSPWAQNRMILKVREPGSLGLKQITNKDIFYKNPEIY